MKYRTGITALASLALALTSSWVLAQGQGQGQGQGQRQDRPQDRAQAERGQQDRDRDRTHAPDFGKLPDQDIYGVELMSAQERNEYRMRLQAATSTAERGRIEAQHRKTVQARAKAQGRELSPPGRGIYGGAIMSVEERNRYREQLRMIDSDAGKARFRAKHREEMQLRAQQQGIDLEDLEETDES